MMAQIEKRLQELYIINKTIVAWLELHLNSILPRFHIKDANNDQLSLSPLHAYWLFDRIFFSEKQ